MVKDMKKQYENYARSVITEANRRVPGATKEDFLAAVSINIAILMFVLAFILWRFVL